MNENQEERITILIELLSSRPSSLKEILTYLKDYKDIEIAGITLKRDIRLMRSRGLDISYESGKYKISGDVSSKKQMILPEEYKHDLPILFSILNSEKDLRIIDWLKEELKEKYNIDEEYWEDETYFSKSLVEQNHDIILELCIELIKYMKKGEAIEFEYRKVENNELKKYTIAPLQIRLHENLYYLFGCAYKENIMEYSVRNFRVDMIENLKIVPAKSNLNSNDKMKYNYNELAKRLDLKNYFKYCLGVYNPTSKDSEIKPLEIKIKFSEWACTYVTKNKIHHTQHIPGGIEREMTENGEIIFCIVRVKVYDTDELKFLLGRFRNYAERLN